MTVRVSAELEERHERLMTALGLDEDERAAHERDVVPSEETRDRIRSRRHREVRARSISIKRMTKRELVVLRELYPWPDGVERPETRGDCVGGPRPCPFVGCRHNLFLDVSERTGAIKLNFPDLEPEDMPADESCCLDVVDRGAQTLENTGRMLNVVRERIRQVEVAALQHFADAMGREVAQELIDLDARKDEP